MLSASLVIAQLPVLFHQTEVKAAFAKVNEESYAETNQKFTTIDLRSVANRGFADDVAGDHKGGWTDQGSENDMRFFNLKGMNRLKGVDFDIIDPDSNDGKSVVVLRGNDDIGVPTTIEIPVNAKGAGVYFLHSSAWLNDICGYYTFVYDDGTTHEVPVRKNIDIFNWWGTGASDTTITAWTGSNNATSAASLYLFTVENPYPEKTIKSIVASTEGTNSYIMLVAMTLTDKGPYLWQDADKSNVDMSDWWAYDIPNYSDIVGTALDMSFTLDAPAGKHGYIQADGQNLYFEDGTPVQFWAVNLGPSSVFINKERIDYLADRLAALGFNLVRFHKLSAANVGAQNIHSSGNIQYDIDPYKLDLLHYTIYSLKQRGIYILMDGLCGGVLADRGQADYGSQFVNDAVKDLSRDYLRQLYNSNNPYTGMKVAEDPAIVMIDLVNETSTYARDLANETEARQNREKFSEWLKVKYGSDEAIRKAWYFDGKEGVLEGESLEKMNYDCGTYSLRKTYTYPRQEDAVHFLSDVYVDYYKLCAEDLRSFGYKGLITAATLFGMNTVALTHANAQTEFIDSHDYWGHPANNAGLRTGTSIGGFPNSMMLNTNLGILGHFMNDSVYGVPHTITEWELCQMNPHIYEGTALMAVQSCMQVWQPFYFAVGDEILDQSIYGISSEGGGQNVLFTEYVDNPNILWAFFAFMNQPIQMATAPTAGIAVQRGDFKEADRGFFNRYGANDYWNNKNAELSKDAKIGMIGKTGTSFDNVSYDEDYNDNEVLYRAVMSDKLKKPFVSITGESEIDIENNTFRANSERTQYVVGTIGGKSFESDDMIVEMTTPKCSVSLTSLDKEAPIWDADKLLLTAAGDARNTDEVRSSDGLQIVKGGHAPILIEPMEGKITIKTKDDLEVYRLASSGERLGTAKTTKDADGNTVIHLSIDDCCLNYEIVRVNRATGERSANEHIEFETIEYKSLFNDIDFDHWAYKTIERNCLQNIMTGVSETEFGAEKAMTRGDFTATVVKALGLHNAATDDTFADVSNKTPNYTEIKLAKYWGIVSGDEDGNFRPNDPVTRAEAIVILDKAMEFMKQPMSATDDSVLSNYTDSDKLPDYAVDSAKAMLSQRYFKELFSGEIEPNKTLTRAEASWIIYGVLWYEV